MVWRSSRGTPGFSACMRVDTQNQIIMEDIQASWEKHYDDDTMDLFVSQGTFDVDLLSDKIPSNELKKRLHLIRVEDVLQWGRLGWYSYLQRLEVDAWPQKILNLNVTGKNSRGQPRKIWNMHNKWNEYKEILTKTCTEPK